MAVRVSVIAAAVASVVCAVPAFAFQPFQVKAIQYQGLMRVSSGALADDAIIKPGQVLTEGKSDALIQKLYASDYFQNIQLFDQKGTLVIKVKERPAISSVNISGNKEIKTKILKTVLREAGFTAGNLFNRAMLKEVTQSLEEAYYSRGKYAVRITSAVVPLPRDRVAIDLNISEGLYAKISHINFVGNHAFSNKTLSAQLSVSTPGLWSFFTHSDRYNGSAMAKSLEGLSSYYMDRGYINFHVAGTQVALAPDKKQIFLNVDLSEGGKYLFSGFKISGNTIVPRSEMAKLVHIARGEVFSRKSIVRASRAMMNVLANKGYAFAHVNPVPTLDQKNHTVSINFYVYPGNIQYIRYINFYGNNIAKDYVLRERMEVQEQGRYHQSKVNDSTLRLQRLPYFEAVQESIHPVTGYNDLIDLDYHIKERSANKAGFSFGYSELNKFIIGTHLNMPDFLGTGNIFGINIQLSKPYQSLNINFDQPYYTQNGIGRSIGFFFTRVDNKSRDIANYTTNSFGTNLNYSIPINADDFFNFGVGYDHTRLLQASDETSATVSRFITDHGNQYNSYLVNMGWSRNTTNNAYFPTQGSNTSLSIKGTVPGSRLKWYKLLFDGEWYHQIFGPNVTFSAHGDFDYGQGYSSTKRLPFFQNFYAGGWGTIRGFAPGSLGPHDKLTCNSGSSSCTSGSVSRGDALGGNLLVAGSLDMYFPIPFLKASNAYRMGVFMDSANVYSTKTLTTGDNSAALPKWPTFGNLRYSAGVAFEWRLPMLGLIGISFAEPFNTKPGDDKQIFNFTLGNTF